MIGQNENGLLKESELKKAQLIAWLVPLLRAIGWTLGVPAGVLIAMLIMGQAPSFIEKTSFMSVRYLALVQIGMLSGGLVFLTRKDDLQAGYDILSIISATVCMCAATAYFFG